MFKTLLNLVIPPRCICNKILINEKSLTCNDCWQKMEFIGSNICDSCGDLFEFEMGEGTICANCIGNKVYFDKARSVFKYNEHSGNIITGLKYQDKTSYSKLLSKWLIKKMPEFENVDIITSVPVHPKKLRQRKYNQSSLLANDIARLSNRKANNLVLLKTKNIPPQASLTRKERIENIKGAIKVNQKYTESVIGKNIIIIDDVFTTGATANECAKELKKAGAAKVFVLTAARTPLEK